MPILTGPAARARLDALKEANDHAYKARRAFLRAKVHDTKAHDALRDMCQATDRLLVEIGYPMEDPDPRCEKCGRPRSDHNVRHMFVGPSQLDTVKSIAVERDALRAENERLLAFVEHVAGGSPKDYTNNADLAQSTLFALRETTND